MLANRFLRVEDIRDYEEARDQMNILAPGVMMGKIPESLVQYSFVMYQVIRLINYLPVEILCAGSFADPISKALKGTNPELITVVDVDPVINMTLQEYDSGVTNKFDIVFSASVIEHVEDDESFLASMCNLTKEGGYGILTCDFNNDWKAGDPVPATDVRLYTEYDLRVRFKKVLDVYNCVLIDEPDWSGEPNFIYQGHLYGFATMVYRREIQP